MQLHTNIQQQVLALKENHFEKLFKRMQQMERLQLCLNTYLVSLHNL